jgi:hypothetical protein
MQTRFLSLHLLIALSLGQLIVGLVTLQTIRNLTEVTDECRERILESGSVSGNAGEVVIDEMARVLGGVGVGGGQAVLRGDGDGDGEEVENVSSVTFFMEELC